MKHLTRWLALMAVVCTLGVPAFAQDGAPKPSAPAKPAQAKPTSAQQEAGEPGVNTSSTALSKAPAAKAAKAAKGSRNAADRVELDTTTITGNRELPKVMYIVPWKRSDIGDLIGRPVNSLLDEILAPVDRDVFRREVVYYQALKPDVAGNPGQPAPPLSPQGEK